MSAIGMFVIRHVFVDSKCPQVLVDMFIRRAKNIPSHTISYQLVAMIDMTTRSFSWAEDTWKLDHRALFEQFKIDMCKSFTLIFFPDYSLL